MSLTAGLAATDRYLDPPVEENFTNHGSTSHVAARLEHDLSLGDRFGVIVRRGDADFLVPNERVQQEAGQRQERSSGETAAQFSYQHIFSGRVVADFRGMARDLTADLRSNAASTPILASQDRGFRELYLKGTVAGHAGAHEWKAGGDVDAASIREAFAYQITDPGRVRRRHGGRVHVRRFAAGPGAGAVRPGPMAAGRMDGQRRSPLGSLPAGRERPRTQSPARSRLVVAGGRLRRAGLLRSRVPDAGGREPAARE